MENTARGQEEQAEVLELMHQPSGFSQNTVRWSKLSLSRFHFALSIFLSLSTPLDRAFCFCIWVVSPVYKCTQTEGQNPKVPPILNKWSCVAAVLYVMCSNILSHMWWLYAKQLEFQKLYDLKLFPFYFEIQTFKAILPIFNVVWQITEAALVHNAAQSTSKMSLPLP